MGQSLRSIGASTYGFGRESNARIIRILAKLVNSDAQKKLESILIKLHPADIAEAMVHLNADTNSQITDILFRIKKAAPVLTELPEQSRASILENLEPRVVSEMIRRLDSDDAVDLLQSLDEDFMHAIMAELNIEEVTEIEQLLLYGEDSAGGLMTTDVFRLENNMQTGKAIELLRAETEEDLEGVQYLYVVDEWNHLVGTVDFKSLLFADPQQGIDEYVRDNVPTVEPQTPSHIVAREMSKYDLLEIAVVDSRNHLMGIITVDDIIDVIQETATEEMYALAGLDEEDRVFSSPLRSVRLRLPWLTINLATAIGAGLVIGRFEESIAAMVMLAMVFPVVASTGGNAAIQTITVIVRGFTLGELSFHNARKAVLREVAVAVGNGIVIGAISAAIVYAWQGNPTFSLVVFLSIAINFLNAAVMGTTVPIILKRLKQDPAVASSIFVTALTDIGGYLIFLTLATSLLR